MCFSGSFTNSKKKRPINISRAAAMDTALSLMSRIYVAPLAPRVGEQMLLERFEAFGPIKKIKMHWSAKTGEHGETAEVEFEVPESAYLAHRHMHGQIFEGNILEVKKVPVMAAELQSIIDMIVSKAHEYPRIFMASIHPMISEQDLIRNFGFGVNWQLSKHPLGIASGHRGFGYLEFNMAGYVDMAVEIMHGFPQQDGLNLQVIRCVTPPPEVLLPRIPSPITTFLPTGGPVRFLPPLTSASFFRLSLIVLAGPLYWRAKCDESFASGDFVLFADAMWHDLVDCIKIKSGVSTTQSMSHDGIADLVNALFPLQMEKFKIVQRLHRVSYMGITAVFPQFPLFVEAINEARWIINNLQLQ